MDIGVHASKDVPSLFALAKEHGLKVTGPIEHAYWDMALPDKPHVLEIWLPVEVEAGAEKTNIAGLQRIEPYKCLSAPFKRPIHEIGDAWGELGSEAQKLGHVSTHHDREIYKVMDCDDPTKNDIELQLGIR